VQEKRVRIRSALEHKLIAGLKAARQENQRWYQGVGKGWKWVEGSAERKEEELDFYETSSFSLEKAGQRPSKEGEESRDFQISHQKGHV